jgi:acetylornithine deacetylase
VKKQFCHQIELASQGDPWLRNNPPRITFKDVGADGAEIPADHPIVQMLCKAFQDSTRRHPTIAGRTGGADSRYLIKYGNTPTVIFGPGITAKMHMTNETVPVSNVVEATKTLALTIHRWCQ